MTVKQRDSAVAALKEWASPILAGLIGMLLWQILNEMRTDLKVLLAQNSANEVRITTLEKEHRELKEFVMRMHAPQLNSSINGN